MLTEQRRRAPRGLLITPGERKALQLLANGSAANEVATSLGIGLSEIDSVLTGLFAAMGVASRAEAIAEAQKRGLLMLTAG
jgi:DNA-binding NarL/FixJ family response regulator